MANKTYHVIPAGGSRWAVKKAGTESAVYSTQGEAIKAATRLAKGEREAQVVIFKAASSRQNRHLRFNLCAVSNLILGSRKVVYAG